MLMARGSACLRPIVATSDTFVRWKSAFDEGAVFAKLRVEASASDNILPVWNRTCNFPGLYLRLSYPRLA
jgi:hypothetical protein